VTYVERTSGELRYGQQQSDGWHIVSLGPVQNPSTASCPGCGGGPNGGYPSLVLSVQDNPRMAYIDALGGLLDYLTTGP
jgi:hypothetical protein